MIATLLLALASQWTPVAPEVSPHPPGGNQRWSRVATDGASEWVAWSGGNDVFARRLDQLGPIVLVNQTTSGTQDEPECLLASGNLIVAWSDRSGQWTDYMSAQGRVLDATSGAPLSSEIALSDLAIDGDASRWRPLLFPLRAGGFGAAFTATWNEAAFVRRFDADGVPLGADAQHSPPSGASSNYPTACETKQGTVLCAFRRANDVWLSKAPQSAAPLWAGQEPRLASNRRGLVALVWHDSGNVFLRRIGPNGALLGSAIAMQPIAGVQRDAAVAVLADSSVLVAWADDFANVVRAAFFDSSGALVQSFQLNSLPLGRPLTGEAGRNTPSVALAPDGKTALIGWGGASRVSGGGRDCFVRRFVR